MFRRIVIAFCAMMSFATMSWAQNPPSDASEKAAASSPAESSGTMEQPLPGDHWTYEIRDEITGVLKYTNSNVVTDVTATEVSVRMENIGHPGTGFLVYDRSWNLKIGPTWKYSPNDGMGIKQPLKAGSSWKFQSSDTYVARGGSFKRSGSAKVLGEERIETPAGTFNAIKIEASINMRNANDPTKKSDVVVTTWYVPSVNHWVKRISKTRADGHVVSDTAEELVEYGRR